MPSQSADTVQPPGSSASSISSPRRRGDVVPSRPSADAGTMPPDPHSPPTPPVDGQPFACAVVHEPHAARVRPVGELDLATVAVLQREVAAVRAAGFKRVIIDLSGLAFIDSTGLRCLLEYDAEARQNGFSLGLIPGRRAVQRIFELTDTETKLPFVTPDPSRD